MLNDANRPSPMKVLTTPPWARIGSSTVSRYSFSAATSRSGSRNSAMVVKPSMSVNRIVASRVSDGGTSVPWPCRMVAGDALVDIAAEGLADALALAQALDHVVELAGDLADLVVRGDGDAARRDRPWPPCAMPRESTPSGRISERRDEEGGDRDADQGRGAVDHDLVLQPLARRRRRGRPGWRRAARSRSPAAPRSASAGSCRRTGSRLRP